MADQISSVAKKQQLHLQMIRDSNGVVRGADAFGVVKEVQKKREVGGVPNCKSSVW